MRLHDHGVGIPSVLESLSSRASLPRMARAFRIKRQSCARTASRAASEAVAKSFYTFAFCTADLLRFLLFRLFTRFPLAIGTKTM